MRVIHCADIHLDSGLSANFDKETARERKAEILRTFVRMTEYAADCGAEAVLIAGDLFDRDVVRQRHVTVFWVRSRQLRGSHIIILKGIMTERISSVRFPRCPTISKHSVINGRRISSLTE